MTESGKMQSIHEIPESSWNKLSQKKIYFGHQSVGNNIIKGLEDILKENPQIKLNIVETNNPADFSAPIFAHSHNGKNHDPISKIDAFTDLMDRGTGDNADIAFFKFCFVDITANTDVQKVFAYYKSKMKYLKGKYPKTTLIHITVPLTTVQTGPKAIAKKLIGKPIDGYADNLKRYEFNEFMRREYEGREPLFDLAKIESTLKDGSNLIIKENGKSFQTLVPEYTHDGGHLNETGRKIVAQSLLVFLTELTEKK